MYSLRLVILVKKPLNNVSLLEEKSNQYYLNGSLYDGSVYELYDSGQLKEEFQVMGGKIEGDKIIYHQDNSYRKDKYKDATLITQLESNLTTLNNELSSMEKDSSGFYNIQKSRDPKWEITSTNTKKNTRRVN